MKPSVLGLITARGNSKGIPRKNIRPLMGKPLIAWSIEAALESNLDRLIVSTDDTEIAEICRQYRADVPFVRPAEMAQDFSDHMEVVLHALNWVITNEKWTPDYVLLLQPTSPFREKRDIRKAIEMAVAEDADSVVGVTRTDAHPYHARQIDEQGMLCDFIEKPEGYLPRQMMPEVFHVNGAIYLAKSSVLLNQHTWHPHRTYPYVMPVERSIDIDTPWDLQLAELILRHGMNPPST